MTLGQKVKYFRKRSNLSQLDVETKLDMSPGSVSRIESDQTNPTKETLLKLSHLFSLSIQEQMFLLGLTTEPVSKAEIVKARNFVKPLFDKDDFYGYILDDRWRLIDFSNGLVKLLGVPKFVTQLARGKSLPKLIFNPKSPIYKYLSWENNIEMAEVQLIRMTRQFAYLESETWFQELYQELLTYPVVQAAQKDLEKRNGPEVMTNHARRIVFKIEGKEKEFYYSRELLKDNPRFYLMEYTPSNAI